MLGACAAPHAQRHAPAHRGGRSAEPDITALRNAVAAFGAGAESDQRHALLIGEALHCRHDPGVARGQGHRRKKLLAGGIAIAIFGHIAAHALAEFGIAHIARDHRDHVPALAVGDRIEGFVDLRIGRDRLMNCPPGDQGVGVHRGEPLGQCPGPDVERWAPFVADPKAHPVGETFVEPDIVPPRRGHQIAEPLVRQLVADDHAEPALLPGRGLIIEHQDRIVVEIGPGVFHRAGHDRRGDLIELGIGESLPEIALKMRDDPLGAFQCIADFTGVLLGGDDPHWQRRGALRGGRNRARDADEWPDHHRHQVGWQRQGRGEAVHLEPTFQRG